MNKVSTCRNALWEKCQYETNLHFVTSSFQLLYRRSICRYFCISLHITPLFALTSSFYGTIKFYDTRIIDSIMIIYAENILYGNDIFENSAMIQPSESRQRAQLRTLH